MDVTEVTELCKIFAIVCKLLHFYLLSGGLSV